MAVIKAAATGNWSATGTWSGGVVPSLNDTVYANGFTVTLDQTIDLTGSTVDTSGSFIPGQIYRIVSVGTTNFALTANCIVPGTNAGTAVAVSSAVGTIFQAVNAGTATTGTARRMGALLNYVNTPLTIATGGGFALSANYNITGAYIQAGSANGLTVSGTASPTLTNCYAIGSAFTAATRAILSSTSGTLTCSTLVAIGGRVAGTYPNSPMAVEVTAGTAVFNTASSITGGSGGDPWGLLTQSDATLSVANSSISSGSGASNPVGAYLFGPCTITGSTITSGGANAIVCYAGSTITGSTITGGVGNAGIYFGSSSATLSIGGTINGGTNATGYGVNNSSTGAVTITGNVTGATGAGVYNATTGPVTITGNVTASSTAAGFINATTGAVTINGTLTPTTGFHALQCTNTTGANITLSGSLIYASNGFAPTNCLKFLVNPTPTAALVRFAKNGSTTYSEFYTADNTSGITGVATTDVRTGVSYGGGLVGTCAVPPASSVASGVPVGATTGTAVLTAAAVWEYATRTLTAGAGISASDVWSHASRTITGGLVDTATTLTNAPTVPSVVQIRAEMDSNSTQLTAIKAKTDLLETTRLAQCSTVATTGAQIAAALS